MAMALDRAPADWAGIGTYEVPQTGLVLPYHVQNCVVNPFPPSGGRSHGEPYQALSRGGDLWDGSRLPPS
jgi:hypothetical protein